MVLWEENPVNGGINSENQILAVPALDEGLSRPNYSLWIETGGASMLSYTARFRIDQKIIKTSSHQKYGTKIVEGNLTLPW
jgi:hypothetical protein